MATATFDSVIPALFPFPLPRPLRDLLGRVVGIHAIERLYETLRSMNPERSIADRLLDFLSVSYSTSDADLARIPRSGPAIVTVNHPFGILEGAVLASLLGQLRTGVRFLANGVLTAIPEVRDMVIPVDPISGRKAIAGNGHGLKKSLDHLQDGGLLVIFPAGEVSHFRWRDKAVTDPEWNPAVARIVKIAARRGCRVPIVPAYIEGSNSALFQIAGMAHPLLRTVLLGRELLNKRGCRIEVRAGAPIAPDKLLAMPDSREQTDYLRWRTYLLASRERFKPHTRLPLLRRRAARAQAEVLLPDADRLAAEVAVLPIVNRTGDLHVCLAKASEIPNVLLEIGRLREITFRAVGEGAGKSLDLDEFDKHYLHLFVWNAAKKEVVGAYRLAGADTIERLYTATLFEYSDAFLDRLGPALELGRSFVRPEYQKGFTPLLLLWKGIGAYVARNPRYKILFGPVSISNQYAAVSRELMVSFLEKYALLRDRAGLLRNRRAFQSRVLKGAHRPAFPNAGFDLEDLSTVLGDVERQPRGVPVLLRQYLKLGGKLLGFNVDPAFSNALDGLIMVDLTQTEPRLLERYLGKREALQFLEFQKGN